MILLGMDYETTGLSPDTDRIIEVGAILWSTSQHKCLESQGYLVKSEVPVSPKITELTGISQAAVDKFGYNSRDALETFLDLAEQADAFVGQNIIQFDKRFLEAWAAREKLKVPDKLWIDTRTDLPGVESKHLGYMAADHGFLNLFPHSALADVQTCIKLASMYDINKVIERAQSPNVILIGHQPQADNSLAKERKFRWNPFYKIWYKVVKQMDLDAEVKAASFKTSVAPPEILLSKLWYDN